MQCRVHFRALRRIAVSVVLIVAGVAISGRAIADDRAGEDDEPIEYEPGTPTSVSGYTPEQLEPIVEPTLRTPPRAVIGFDFGFGGIAVACGGCGSGGGVSADVYAGALVHERIAVVADLWSVVHLLPTGAVTGTNSETLALASAQVWATPILWARAGAGAGLFAHVTTGPDEVAFAPAVAVAAGAELRHDPDFGIDFAGRVGVELSDPRVVSLAVHVGYHWY
jgi:hypothetical protein